jgi:dipeptidyl-peptidase-4
MKNKILLSIGFCIFMHVSALAQNNPLNLEDIYKKNLYGAKGFGPIRFMKDNKGYTT